MREIKFRAWEWDNRRMWSWSEILKDREVLQSALGREAFMTQPPQYLYELMQYTGLLDRNGVEIYEGDIVRLWTPMFYDTDEREPSRIIKVIQWNAKRCGFNIYGTGGYEVIGNIYENPDLIEGIESNKN